MTWDEFAEYISTDENVEGEDWSEYIDDLYELHLHPIDINTATLHDLKQIPILSERQAEDLRMYVLTYGQMRTMGELLAIGSIGMDMRRILPLFMTAVPIQREWHDTLRIRGGQHDLLTRLEVPLHQRQGNLDGKYQGRGIAHRARYHYRAGKRLEIGIGCEKDAGEPMTFKLGYDHCSGYVMLKNTGRIYSAVAGDYRMVWGQGLLISTRFTMGKSTFTTTTGSGVSGHRSAAEGNYLRGGAITVGSKPARQYVAATAFISYRQLDATTDASGYATNLNTSGNHRTDSEIARRHNQRQTLAGAHLSWHTGKDLNIGATAFAERYYRPFTRGTEAYRRHAPEGHDFWGASVDYDLRIGTFYCTGETATDGHGIATLNHLSWRHSQRFTATFSQRYYSPSYHSFMSHAFAEYGVQNEHGYYLCINSEPTAGLALQGYVDLFYRPQQSYRLPHPTHGQDVRLKATYQLATRHNIEARAQWKHKEVYYDQYVSQKYLLAHLFANGAWSVKTQAQMHHYSTARGTRAMGTAVHETVRWSRHSWRIALSAAWFKTDDYYSRLYLSLPSIQGVSSTMFYGHGVSGAATLRHDFGQWGTATVCYTIARYFDRDSISSALQQISGRVKNDIALQLRIKL